jgi:pimeloyl-ACP methyl ester carboxylesterase
MNRYMGRTKKPLIIVAIECNHEGNRRLVEYSPMSYENSAMGKIRGKGNVYMNWLVKTMKPFIDKNYRTLPDRMNTIIAGSSMGGLMALYGACAFNHVFQRAACLSPSLWVAPGKVLEMVARARIKNDTCVYLDYGSLEMFNHAANAESLISSGHLLLTKRVNLSFRIVPGGTRLQNRHGGGEHHLGPALAAQRHDAAQEADVLLHGMDGLGHGCLDIHIPIAVVEVHQLDVRIPLKHLIGLPQGVGGKAAVIFGTDNIILPCQQFLDVILIPHPNGITQQQYFFHHISSFLSVNKRMAYAA